MSIFDYASSGKYRQREPVERIYRVSLGPEAERGTKRNGGRTRVGFFDPYGSLQALLVDVLHTPKHALLERVAWHPLGELPRQV